LLLLLVVLVLVLAGAFDYRAAFLSCTLDVVTYRSLVTIAATLRSLPLSFVHWDGT